MSEEFLETFETIVNIDRAFVIYHFSNDKELIEKIVNLAKAFEDVIVHIAMKIRKGEYGQLAIRSLASDMVVIGATIMTMTSATVFLSMAERVAQLQNMKIDRDEFFVLTLKRISQVTKILYLMNAREDIDISRSVTMAVESPAEKQKKEELIQLIKEKLGKDKQDLQGMMFI